MDKTIEHGQFIIRVYGILINDNKEVLLSDEYRFDMLMTKFPGGGMNFGEGPEDCLRREALEEFGQPAEIISHFYTTGFFQKAMFFEKHQLISIYYRISLPGKINFPISKEPYNFSTNLTNQESFRWQKLDKLTKDDLSFPVDKFVAGMLIEQYKQGIL